MGANWAWVMTFLSATSLLLGIVNMIWTWMSKGGAALAEKLKGHEGKLVEHDRRIQAIEGELKHLPSKEDVAGLRLQIAGIEGKLNTAEAELGSVARTVRRIEDHLLGEKA